jgi:hypothetical protein
MTRIPDTDTARAAYVAAFDARDAAFVAYHENPTTDTLTAYQNATDATREAQRLYDLAQRMAAVSGGAA